MTWLPSYGKYPHRATTTARLNHMKQSRKQPPPRIGQDAPMIGVCHYCSKSLHPTTEDLWENAWYVFTHGIRFRGRATRREFWSYVPFAACVAYLMELTWSVCQTAQIEEGTLTSVAGCILQVLSAWLLLALLAVTVRRLHDAGRSAWWLVPPAICCAAYPYMAEWEDRALRAHEPSTCIELATYALVFAAFLFCVYILVQLFMPSQPSMNICRYDVKIKGTSI